LYAVAVLPQLEHRELKEYIRELIVSILCTITALRSYLAMFSSDTFNDPFFVLLDQRDVSLEEFGWKHSHLHVLIDTLQMLSCV
jgi:hypothetical protein